MLSADVVVVFDGTSGIYDLRFDRSQPMPPEPWMLDLDVDD